MIETKEHTRPPGLANAAFDVVAIAASAGGLRALSHVIGALPTDLPAAVAIVQHLDPATRA